MVSHGTAYPARRRRASPKKAWEISATIEKYLEKPRKSTTCISRFRNSTKQFQPRMDANKRECFEIQSVGGYAVPHNTALLSVPFFPERGARRTPRRPGRSRSLSSR